MRLFRSLDPLVGADTEKRHGWMHTRNTSLGAVPAKFIRTPQGLVATLSYLDGIRKPLDARGVGAGVTARLHATLR